MDLEREQQVGELEKGLGEIMGQSRILGKVGLGRIAQ